MPGMDRQSPSVSVPVSHRIVAGMASVTMPGSRRMVRRCFHDRITDSSRAPWANNDAQAAGFAIRGVSLPRPRGSD